MTDCAYGCIIIIMCNKNIGGIIVINTFLRPKESVKQAERLKEEFFKRGIEAKVITDGFLHASADKNSFALDFKDCDFCIFLDKDKYFSGILSECGVRLFNSHAAIRLCDDKGESYIKLCGKEGVKLPKTIFAPVCYDKSDAFPEGSAEKIAEKLGFPIVVKESYGSMGKGVHKADNLKELEALMEMLKTVPHIYQEYMGKRPGVDVRIIVVGGFAIAGMERVNENDFRSNIALGGNGVAIDLNECAYKDYKKSAEKVAELLSLDYCGIDFLYGNENEPVFCEVNSNAFFGEMERVSGVNVAGLYAEHVINCVLKDRGGDVRG